MLLHLTVVENDHTGVSVVLLLHLVFGIDALPLDLGTGKTQTFTLVMQFVMHLAENDKKNSNSTHRIDEIQVFMSSYRNDHIKFLTNALLNLLVRQLVQCFC